MHQRKTWDLCDLSLPHSQAPSFTNIDANSSRSNTRYKSFLASLCSICQPCTAGWRDGLGGGRGAAAASGLGAACCWPKGLPPIQAPVGCSNVSLKTYLLPKSGWRCICCASVLGLFFLKKKWSGSFNVFLKKIKSGCIFFFLYLWGTI